MEEFTKQVIKIVKDIPKGKVMTYGQVAFNAGNPFGARQVSRILHSMSQKEKLPWHRIINAQGKISLGGELGIIQKSMLIDEGIIFKNNTVNLREYSIYLEEENNEN
ncbi:MGMT family protein [Mycoplasmatota bacterium]|nr:MGMT family protein [Mycoplasmatota bacterium]